jgi:ubiquinone/menaquinone biosynthesis C-methylase UbiE
VDIDPDSPADIIADGCNLPFRDKAFDYVIQDYVTNFLPKDFLITRMIKEANRVGAHVVGRATITPGRKISLPGPKQRFTHPSYPPWGIRWMEAKGERL